MRMTAAFRSRKLALQRAAGDSPNRRNSSRPSRLIVTLRPVGFTPGNNAGISQLCVKLIMTSSTTWVSPTVREIGVTKRHACEQHEI